MPHTETPPLEAVTPISPLVGPKSSALYIEEKGAELVSKEPGLPRKITRLESTRSLHEALDEETPPDRGQMARQILAIDSPYTASKVVQETQKSYRELLNFLVKQDGTSARDDQLRGNLAELKEIDILVRNKLWSGETELSPEQLDKVEQFGQMAKELMGHVEIFVGMAEKAHEFRLQLMKNLASRAGSHKEIFDLASKIPSTGSEGTHAHRAVETQQLANQVSVEVHSTDSDGNQPDLSPLEVPGETSDTLPPVRTEKLPRGMIHFMEHMGTPERLQTQIKRTVGKQQPGDQKLSDAITTSKDNLQKQDSSEKLTPQEEAHFEVLSKIAEIYDKTARNFLVEAIKKYESTTRGMPDSISVLSNTFFERLKAFMGLDNEREALSDGSSEEETTLTNPDSEAGKPGASIHWDKFEDLLKAAEALIQELEKQAKNIAGEGKTILQGLNNYRSLIIDTLSKSETAYITDQTRLPETKWTDFKKEVKKRSPAITLTLINGIVGLTALILSIENKK